MRPARASAAATTATVAGQELAAIAADPSFVFATDLAGTAGAGEASPIDTAYWLGVHEVTNAQYLDFVTGTGQDTPAYWDDGTYPDGKADHPVLALSLDSATAYCAWLNSQADVDGWTFRLPTEAEWGNAAPAPTPSPTPGATSPAPRTTLPP